MQSEQCVIEGMILFKLFLLGWLGSAESTGMRPSRKEDKVRCWREKHARVRLLM